MNIIVTVNTETTEIKAFTTMQGAADDLNTTAQTIRSHIDSRKPFKRTTIIYSITPKKAKSKVRTTGKRFN